MAVLSTSMSVLQTKFSIPQVSPWILFRPRLEKKLKQISKIPLTLLHSGPGYGKSTAIAEYASSYSGDLCMITLDEKDRFLPRFLANLIFSLQTRFPHFADHLKVQLMQDILQNRMYSNEQVDSLCVDWINHILSLERHVVIVLDDWHIVESEEQICQFMSLWICNLPHNIHLVISSRTRPCWPFLTQWKVKGKVLEISEKDLAFSREEIHVLFTDLYECPLPDDEIDTIYRLTEGWAIALNMFWLHLRDGASIESLASPDGQDCMEDFFSYLATDVFYKQPEHIQQFLLQTSILPVWDTEAVAEICGCEDGEQKINWLIENNLFVIQAGEGKYRYHALFKDFLIRKLKEDPFAFKTVHRAASIYYVDRGLYHKAFYHFKEIRDITAISFVLKEKGFFFIQQGWLDLVDEMVSYIGERRRECHYIFDFLTGEVCRYRNQFNKALHYYKKAVKIARRMGDIHGIVSGLEGQIRVYLDTIQPAKAEKLLSEAISLMGEDSKIKLRLYRLMAENLLNRGYIPEAESWFQRSVSIDSSEEKDDWTARYYLRTGRLQECKKILMSYLNDTQDTSSKLTNSHRENTLLLSILAAFYGDGELAHYCAEKGMILGTETNSPFVEACGWMRIGHAVQMKEQFDFGAVEQCYRIALSLMEHINVSRGKAEPMLGLCLLYAHQGDYEHAIECGEKSLFEAEIVEDRWFASLVRLSLGIAWYLAGNGEMAKEIFSRANRDFSEIGDRYGHSVALLWLSLIAYESNDQTSFILYMNSLLNMVKENEYEFLFYRQTMFSPRDLQRLVPLLIEARKRGIYENYAQQILRKMGFDKLSTHPGYTLKIQTLGGFKVWLGNQRVDEKAWQREKARMLFQLFLTRRNQLLSRDEIFHYLWDGVDEETAARDLKVALNALNKVLEPKRRARSTYFFICRQNGGYGLNPSSGYQLDSEIFEKEVIQGLGEKNTEKAIGYLKKGLKRYQGEFLPELRYEDWAREERERLLRLFLRGAERLANLLLEEKREEESMEWAQKMLEFDSCCEEAYRILMLASYRTKRRSEAIRWYKKCKQELEKELGVSPMKSIVELYENIRIEVPV